jgi:hypothetical protein
MSTLSSDGSASSLRSTISARLARGLHPLRNEIDRDDTFDSEPRGELERRTSRSTRDSTASVPPRDTYLNACQAVGITSEN